MSYIPGTTTQKVSPLSSFFFLLREDFTPVERGDYLQQSHSFSSSISPPSALQSTHPSSSSSWLHDNPASLPDHKKWTANLWQSAVKKQQHHDTFIHYEDLAIVGMRMHLHVRTQTHTHAVLCNNAVQSVQWNRVDYFLQILQSERFSPGRGQAETPLHFSAGLQDVTVPASPRDDLKLFVFFVCSVLFCKPLLSPSLYLPRWVCLLFFFSLFPSSLPPHYITLALTRYQ